MEKHKETGAEMVAKIDRGIADAESITIEQALNEAVEKKRMTVEEAQACLDAYVRSFEVSS